MSTVSEQFFEQLCNAKSIQWERIRESGTRLADYKIWLSNTLAVAEVKQLDLNEDDKALISAVQNNADVPSGFRTTGHIRVRNALDKGYPQLKNVAKEELPAILVIYDNTQGLSHLGYDDILNAMYGDETVTMRWLEYEPKKTEIIAHRFGGNRRVSRQSYRALSGIGLLYKDMSREALALDLFHNVHARNRLGNELGWCIADRQFTVADSDNYHDWIQIAR